MIKFFEKRKKLSIFITFLIIVLIFYMSCLPSEIFSGLPFWLDVSWNSISYHFLIFSLLSFFSFVSLRSENSKTFLVVILLLFVYSFLDECHQYFVSGRYFSYFDLLVNSIGILFGVEVAFS